MSNNYLYTYLSNLNVLVPFLNIQQRNTYWNRFYTYLRTRRQDICIYLDHTFCFVFVLYMFIRINT